MRILIAAVICLGLSAFASAQHDHDDHAGVPHSHTHDSSDGFDSLGGFPSLGNFDAHGGNAFADPHSDHGGHDHSRHFDVVRPYESHARGVGAAHGHSGHTSVEGYPFVHGIRTEIDFVERALELDLVRTGGADGGMVDELEFEAEIVWALNSRAIFILGVPLISLDPEVESNTTGYGDLELGFQYLAFGGRRDLFFVALNMTVPTGDADRDLGSGRTILEPTALWLHDFSGGTYVQSRFALEVPVSTPEVANQFLYDMSLFHTFLGTEHWRVFRYFTPIVECNGVTALNGADSSETIVDLTSGVRWIVRELDEVGLGYSVPVTGTEGFDWQVLVSYRLHF